MRALVLTLALSATAALPASAAVLTVLGKGAARDCYVAAELQRSDRASLAVCDEALREGGLSRRDLVATHVNRGIIRIYARDEAASLEDFDRALAIDPDIAEAKVNKAIAILRMEGDFQTAIALATEALALGVSRPEVAYYTRGMAYDVTGDAANAYRDYQRAAAIRPEWSDPARQLARFTVTRGS